MKKINIALAGNPNCGKTALFNVLTRSRQRVGNWPGVTVTYKQGEYQEKDHKIVITDLPGVYSLSANSARDAVDEQVACEYLLTQPIDLIINVIDANNLERNLYLTTQLLEIGLPIILVVNMMDVAQQNGIRIQLNKLSKALKCPVVPMVAKKQLGLANLKRKILQTIQHPEPASTPQLLFDPVLQATITTMKNKISQSLLPHASINHHWMAIKLLEGNLVLAHESKRDLMHQAKRAINQVKTKTGEEPDILIADARYAFIHQLVHQLIKVVPTKQKSITRFIDRIVLNRIIGIPIFLLIIYGVFYFSINIAGAFQDFFDIGSDVLFVQGFSVLLMHWHAPPWLIAVLANGAGKGLNTTLTFLPVIGGMFFCLSLLEDSGYMVRAVFLMDRMMRFIGLSGKAFLPMVMGFGCNVPAVLVTRTLENPQDRILTIMMLPFMTCGARLAIFAVFAAAFFPSGGQNVIFILYLIGITFSIATGFLLRKTLLKGGVSPLIMELPAYHIPHLRSLWRLTWYRMKSFLFKAGKVIIPFALLLGLLNTLTPKGEFVHSSSANQSILAITGKTITPIFSPLGVTKENWPATVGLMTGVVAKEVVIGTLNTLYSQQLNLRSSSTMRQMFSVKSGLLEAFRSIPANLKGLGLITNPAPVETDSTESHAVYGLMAKRFDGSIGAFSYLLFVLLYFPCIATVAVMRREAGANWTWFSIFWMTGLAYLMATLFYQTLTFPQHMLQSFLWITGIIVIFVSVAFVLWRFFTKTNIEERK
jgi:ferrous iron transport protein B